MENIEKKQDEFNQWTDQVLRELIISRDNLLPEDFTILEKMKNNTLTREEFCLYEKGFQHLLPDRKKIEEVIINTKVLKPEEFDSQSKSFQDEPTAPREILLEWFKNQLVGPEWIERWNSGWKKEQ